MLELLIVILLHLLFFLETGSIFFQKLGVPQNGVVKIMENPIKNGWFGGTHILWKHPHVTQKIDAW